MPEHLDHHQIAAVADHLPQAALYFIDPDFTDLAEHATTNLPDSRLTTDDVPTTHGLVVWARPITEHHIHAATWTVHNGLILAAYRSLGAGLNPTLLQRTREQVGWLAPSAPCTSPIGQAIPAGSPDRRPRRDLPAHRPTARRHQRRRARPATPARPTPAPTGDYRRSASYGSNPEPPHRHRPPRHRAEPGTTA